MNYQIVPIQDDTMNQHLRSNTTNHQQIQQYHSDTIKSKPLPPVRTWCGDSTGTRRPSTSSLSSPTSSLSPSTSSSTSPLSSSWTPPPVHPVGKPASNERAIPRPSQPNGHYSSPYLDPSDHVIQRSKAKAKTRSVRGVASAVEEKRSQVRLHHNQCFARAWQECLITNPHFIREGMTEDGRRGLRRLSSNNRDGRLDNPSQISKDQLVDLLTICHRQFRNMVLRQIERHHENDRHIEALELEIELRQVGTHL